MQIPTLCIAQNQIYETVCATNLRPGQYLCPPPEIDTTTQQPKGCTRNNTANSISFFIYVVLGLHIDFSKIIPQPHA